MPYSRKRARSRSVDFSRAVKTARRTGTTGVVSRARRSRAYMKLRPLASRVNNLYRMIETKESMMTGTTNLALPHNNVIIYGVYNTNNLPYALTVPMNPFRTQNATDDPMNNLGGRIGDAINVRGLLIRGFFENALQRPKVYYRVMVLRGAKGEPFDRATIFKNASPNKMIDQLNTERYSVVAQKIFNIRTDNNPAASGAGLTGVPTIGDTMTLQASIGTKTFKMWIPGRKFGHNGNIQYENGNQTQVKFYDYRVVILAYDWYGTPQDINAVGRVNDMYCKLYYKDA